MALSAVVYLAQLRRARKCRNANLAEAVPRLRACNSSLYNVPSTEDRYLVLKKKARLAYLCIFSVSGNSANSDWLAFWKLLFDAAGTGHKLSVVILPFAR